MYRHTNVVMLPMSVCEAYNAFLIKIMKLRKGFSPDLGYFPRFNFSYFPRSEEIPQSSVQPDCLYCNIIAVLTQAYQNINDRSGWLFHTRISICLSFKPAKYITSQRYIFFWIILEVWGPLAWVVGWDEGGGQITSS